MGVDVAIDLTTEQRTTILELLDRHLPGTEAWVYGSRVQRTSRPHSDLDLVVFATSEQRRQVGDLREAFEESNLPSRVDLFVWDDVLESFRKQIEAEHVVLAPTSAEKANAYWQDTFWGDIVTLQYGRALRGHDTAQGSFCVFGTNGPIGTRPLPPDAVRWRHPSRAHDRLSVARSTRHQDQPHGAGGVQEPPAIRGGRQRSQTYANRGPRPPKTRPSPSGPP